ITPGNYISADPQVGSLESGDLAGLPSGRVTVDTADVTDPFDTLSANGTPFVGDEFHNRSVLTYFGAGSRSFRHPLLKNSDSELTLRNVSPTPWAGIGHDAR